MGATDDTATSEVLVTFESLPKEYQARLTALLEELDSFAVPELLVRCLEVVNISGDGGPDGLSIDAVVDSTLAGAWAYDRMVSYLLQLRLLWEERTKLGKAIYQLRQYPTPTSEEELAKFAKARVWAPHLAGQQEVVTNFFCISVQHIRSLLLVVAEAVGYEIPAKDLAFLDEFRYLRNHFEHWYERLPGKINEAGLITKAKTASEYRVQGGLATDARGRYVVIEPKKSGPVAHVVDATRNGLARIEGIVQETDKQVRHKALDAVRKHYIKYPQNIPAPNEIPQTLLIDVGGFEPGAR